MMKENTNDVPNGVIKRTTRAMVWIHTTLIVIFLLLILFIVPFIGETYYCDF